MASVSHELSTPIGNSLLVAHSLTDVATELQHQLDTGQLPMAALGEVIFEQLKTTFTGFMEQVLGLHEEPTRDPDALIDGMLTLYKEYKTQKRGVGLIQ